MTIPVVDIFAGPGGLGEGFSAFHGTAARRGPFRIAVSAEMEIHAATTLRLRAFFRQFPHSRAPSSYYDYVAGRTSQPWTEASKAEWLRASEEALQLKLGEPEDDSRLQQRIRASVSDDRAWILVGGPPCQAYSLVGRARNQGVKGYTAALDSRHFLYQHYLKIIGKFRPAVFVMENVKGILSSKVGGEEMFPRIIDDLSKAGGRNGHKYRIVPVIQKAHSKFFEPTDYIVRAEQFGVPQNRHRVILLGISEGIDFSGSAFLKPAAQEFSVKDVIGGMPRLRSGMTDRDVESWPQAAEEVLREASARCKRDAPEISEDLRRAAQHLHRRDPGIGARWAEGRKQADVLPDHLSNWLRDERMDGYLNHQARAHMAEDLMRYCFASSFAKRHKRSPKGAAEFPEALHPKHKNWKTGKFADRFKVQVAGSPSSTVTSHLSKDGHYFIHHDPEQMRSLSVREAARLQTFPDNYFFEGKQGAQYRQVGNAVPPWLAYQIAGVVHKVLS